MNTSINNEMYINKLLRKYCMYIVWFVFNYHLLIKKDVIRFIDKLDTKTYELNILEYQLMT